MSAIRIFMVGDVMLARGIDMIQRYSCDPTLYEANGMTAHGYVTLTTRHSGPLPPKEKRSIGYIWGDAIQILDEKSPDLRIINLETSVTTSNSPWPLKGIHYKMHPKNLPSIQVAKIDCCVLANNHTADWGFQGLVETLTTMKEHRMTYAGAGFNLEEAQAPAVFSLPGKGRVLVFGAGHQSSGIPDEWHAKHKKEGLHILDMYNLEKAKIQLQQVVEKYKKPGDIAVLSVHWGGNWGYEIDSFQSNMAHWAIDNAGIDLVHGHSSHHVKAVEVYKEKLIIYGCGDFLNDYEGIGGHSLYRGELALMYFADIVPGDGVLKGLQMTVTETRHLRVNRAKNEDVQWMEKTMKQECKKFGLGIRRDGGDLHLVFSSNGVTTHL